MAERAESSCGRITDGPLIEWGFRPTARCDCKMGHKGFLGTFTNSIRLLIPGEKTRKKPREQERGGEVIVISALFRCVRNNGSGSQGSHLSGFRRPECKPYELLMFSLLFQKNPRNHVRWTKYDLSWSHNLIHTKLHGKYYLFRNAMRFLFFLGKQLFVDRHRVQSELCM